jgi:hypothetical protein
MKPLSRLALVALLVAAPPLARSAAAQVNEGRSHRWYWGAQAGGFLYQTNVQGYVFDPVFGANWLITGKRSALYLGAEQAFFLADSRATVVDPATGSAHDIVFSQVRRIFVGLLAYPLQKRIEPFGGGGFAIVTVTNAAPDCSGTSATTQCPTPQDEALAQALADETGSKANAWFMGGIQINVGRLAVYGQYTVSSAAANFLIQGATHTIQGGVRYSLGSSKEDVGTAH